ncbi:hypothetical protein MASR2M117_15650 [Paludibacter sp.]
MKKVLILTGFLYCIGLLIHAQNLVTNSDFENWTYTGQSGDSLAMPNTWARGAGTVGTHYFYTTDSERGNVLQLVDPVSESVGAKRFHSLANINIQDAGTYRVSFWVKGNVGLRAVVLTKGTGGPNTNTQSATNHYTALSAYPSGTNITNWTKVTTDIMVPSTATFGDDYRFHISWSSSSTSKPVCDFLIDDIIIQKLSDEGLNSISVIPLNYSTSTGTPSFVIPDFSPEILHYTFVSSYIEVPVVEAEAAKTSSTVSITQPTSLTGALAERTATIVVTTTDSKVTTYTVVFEKHSGFISGIPWDIRNTNPVEWSEVVGVYSKNTSSGTNHGNIPSIGNTSIRCNSTSEPGFYLTTPVLENGASTLSFFLKNTDIDGDDTPVVVMKSDDTHLDWTEIHRVTPNTSEWSEWKEVLVNVNDNTPGLKIKFVFEKSILTSGTVYFDDVEIQPFGYTSTENITSSDMLVYGFNNQIYFSVKEPVNYTIYALNGIKVTEGTVSSNAAISLTKGVYLVKIGDKAVKVIL